MEATIESGSPPLCSMDVVTTPPTSSDGLETKEERSRDLMETRTASTTTLHRLDMSPAPSSAPTARRSDGSSRSEELRFRLLCSSSLVGQVIGRKGENIKRLRRESSADIIIEDFVPGSEERVISLALHRDGPNHSSNSGGDALVAVFDNLCEMARDSFTTTTMSSDDQDHAGSAGEPDEDNSMNGTRIIHEIGECEARVLVDTSQVGFIVGKAGASIKKTMEDSGATVRVLPKAELPSCAWVSDEVLHLSGTHSAVSAALRIIARQLEQHPPRVHNNGICRPPLLLAQASIGDAHYMTPPSPALYGGYISPSGLLTSGLVETVFRLLAPVMRAGNIIGRNGDHVRRIRSETGARIKLYDPEEDADERLVCVFSTEDAVSQYCAAQDALVRCAISLTADDASSGQHCLRILAPQMSIGAVLGKRGLTVMQLRHQTGASIRVHPVEAPLAAAAAAAHGGGEPGGDEIIQIEGSMQQCVSALRGVATLLRGWQIKRAVSIGVQRPTVAAVALAPATLLTHQSLGGHSFGHHSLAGHHSPTLHHSSHMNSNSNNNINAAAALHHHHHHNPSMTAHIHHHSLLAIPMGPPSSGTASPAGHFTTLSPSLSTLSGHQIHPSSSPVLWRYRLSNAQAGAVIGKGGHHVSQIRNLTGARVHLPTDQGPDGCRTLEISGSVESCQTAHALVNQFLAMGQCTPAVPELQSGAVFASPASSPLNSSPGSPHAYRVKEELVF